MLRPKGRTTNLVLLLLAAIPLAGCPCGKPPKAAFRAAPTSGEWPLDVQFTDLSLPGGAEITRWRWSFDDGCTSEERNPRHTFEAIRTYTVALTVETAVGADTVTQEDGIVVEGYLGPEFQIRCWNTGDYPIVAAYVTPTSSPTWGYVNRVPEPIPGGASAILDGRFDKGGHLVVVAFEVGDRLEEVQLPGNLDTFGMPYDWVALRTWRDTDGAIGIEPEWGSE